jgi:AraC-like DNA-binding protein
MSEPLHARFSTQDPDEMTEKVSVLAADVAVEKRAVGRFSASVDAVRLDEMAMARISTRNIRVLATPGRNFTSLTVPLRSGFEIDRSRICDRYEETAAHIHSPDLPFDLSAADTSVLVLNFDNPFLRSTASKLGGGEQEPSQDLYKRISLSSQSGARLWRAAYSLWLRASKEHDSSDLAMAEQEKEVAAGLLLVGGIDHGHSLSTISRRNSVAGMKRAEEWILCNLDKPISRADLCQVSGLHVRVLTRAFAKHHGEGPMQFVRDRRLDAAQRTLLGSELGEVSVTQVATNFGFCHLSRFAADYCNAFGEHPSETLRNKHT